MFAGLENNVFVIKEINIYLIQILPNAVVVHFTPISWECEHSSSAHFFCSGQNKTFDSLPVHCGPNLNEVPFPGPRSEFLYRTAEVLLQKCNHEDSLHRLMMFCF